MTSKAPVATAEAAPRSRRQPSSFVRRVRAGLRQNIHWNNPDTVHLPKSFGSALQTMATERNYARTVNFWHMAGAAVTNRHNLRALSLERQRITREIGALEYLATQTGHVYEHSAGNYAYGAISTVVYPDRIYHNATQISATVPCQMRAKGEPFVPVAPIRVHQPESPESVRELDAYLTSTYGTTFADVQAVIPEALSRTLSQPR